MGSRGHAFDIVRLPIRAGRSLRPALVVGSVVFVAALFMVVASSAWSDPIREILIAVAVGILFIIAAALISGTLKVEFTPEEEESRGGRGRLTAAEPNGSVQLTPAARQRMKEALRHAVVGISEAAGQQVARAGAPMMSAPAGPVEPDNGEDDLLSDDFLNSPEPPDNGEGLHDFNRDTLELLVAEGKDLLTMARKLGIDRSPYAHQLARARRAMMEGRIEDSIQVMQFANERIRMRLEKQVTP